MAAKGLQQAQSGSECSRPVRNERAKPAEMNKARLMGRALIESAVERS